MNQTLIEHRSMCPDIYWSSTEDLYCNKCENEIQVEAEVSCYIVGWIEDFGAIGGKFTRIKTLDNIIQDYFRNTHKMRVYKHRMLMLEDYIDGVLGYVEKLEGMHY